MHSLICISTLFVIASAAKPPVELFSPLVPQKVLATLNALPVPTKYPQYTNREGTWLYFSPNSWTSGFFPATAYALNTRKDLCGASDANGLDAADWVALGQTASSGLIPLESNNSIGHDVGFVSFPFMEELKM